MKWGLKGGISIDADSGPPRYVLWCCGGICHQPDTFIKVGCGHTVCQVLVQGDHISTETDSDSTSKELSGDLQIRGTNVFKCYYGRDEATKKEFTEDGWFKTGDTAQFLEQSFKILGRSSVDIIKSGKGPFVNYVSTFLTIFDQPSTFVYKSKQLGYMLT